MKFLVACSLLLLVVCCVSPSVAQVPDPIPNGDFELWQGNNPGGWVTSNASPVENVTFEMPGHSAAYGAKGTVINLMGTGMPFGPVLQIGPGGEGVPYTSRPASFNLWYKFSPMSGSGDRFGVNVWIVKGTIDSNEAVAVAAAAIPTPAASWTSLSVPFQYFSNETPTLLLVQLLLVGPDTTHSAGTIGSWFVVDELTMQGWATTDVKHQATTSVPTEFSLSQNYPNPFNPVTTIGYTVAGTGDQGSGSRNVKLVVYNLLGQEVATLVNEAQAPGRYSVRFDAGKLPSGIYLYRLQAGNYVETKRMLLLK